MMTTTHKRPRKPAALPGATRVKRLDELRLDPANRRLHPDRNLGMVRDSLREVGAARSIVIDEDDVILAGNGVTTAAVAAGITNVRIIDAAGDELIAVRRTGLTPAQKRALAIFDNRTAELAEWNIDQLRDDKAAGLDLRPFWTPEEEAALMRAARLRQGLTDPDDVPEERRTTIQRGDLFQLGAHRLLCGDSAASGDVARLVAGARVDCLFTSPPYNVDVQYATHDDTHQPVEQYLAWLAEVARVWVLTLGPGRAFVWNIGVSPRTAPHRQLVMLEEAGLTFLREFIWHKVGVPVPSWYHTREHPVARQLSSNYTHELVYLLARGDLEFGAPTTFDDTLEHDVFELHQATATQDLPAGPTKSGSGRNINLDRRASKVHPAVFPVKLPGSFLAHLTGPDELAVDPFAGSGSTLIACEQLQRRCCAMEVSPVYCQVIIDRWEAFTGQHATQLQEGPSCADVSPSRRRRNASRATRAAAR